MSDYEITNYELRVLLHHYSRKNLDLEDGPRSARPTVLDGGDLQAALDVESSLSTRELSEELGVDQKTVWNHLKQHNFVYKKPRQDPHELTEAQAANCSTICWMTVSDANCDIRREVGLPGQSRSKQTLGPKRSSSFIRSKTKSIWKEDHDLR